MRTLDDAQADLAVVKHKVVAGLDGIENLLMRQEHALGRARRFVAIQNQHGFFSKRNASRREFANAELGALQVSQDADGVAMPGGAGAHGVVKSFGAVVGRVAHVDAEHIDARNKKPLDHFGSGGRWTKRRDNLDPAISSHFSLFPWTSGSVRRMVHSFASPVSTSKKPERL